MILLDALISGTGTVIVIVIIYEFILKYNSNVEYTFTTYEEVLP